MSQETENLTIALILVDVVFLLKNKRCSNDESFTLTNERVGEMKRLH